jgi:hypothetical protein
MEEVIEKGKAPATRARVLKRDQDTEAEKAAERNIDEIWEGIMSDDMVQCGFALARLSPLAQGAVRASYATIERVVALIGGTHRASALDIAKRAAGGALM